MYFKSPAPSWDRSSGIAARMECGGSPSSWMNSPRRSPRLTPLNSAFQHLGAYLVLGLVCLVSWKMIRLVAEAERLFSQVGLVFFLFLSVSSGFGVQYLAWLVPWIVELGWLATAMFYVTSGIFLFLVYNLWAEGLPWYLANSYALGTYLGYYDYSHLICWISLLLVLWIAAKRIFPMRPLPRIGPGREPPLPPSSYGSACLLKCPCPSQPATSMRTPCAPSMRVVIWISPGARRRPPLRGFHPGRARSDGAFARIG